MIQYTLRFLRNDIEKDYYFSAFNKDSAYILAEDKIKNLTIKHPNDTIVDLGLWDEYGDRRIERNVNVED